MILDALWGPEFLTETNVVERHIRALRVKLGDNTSKTRYIQSGAPPALRASDETVMTAKPALGTLQLRWST